MPLVTMTLLAGRPAATRRRMLDAVGVVTVADVGAVFSRVKVIAVPAAVLMVTVPAPPRETPVRS